MLNTAPNKTTQVTFHSDIMLKLWLFGEPSMTLTWTLPLNSQECLSSVKVDCSPTKCTIPVAVALASLDIYPASRSRAWPAPTPGLFGTSANHYSTAIGTRGTSTCGLAMLPAKWSGAFSGRRSRRRISLGSGPSSLVSSKADRARLRCNTPGRDGCLPARLGPDANRRG
jgi:hypothetical protein